MSTVLRFENLSGTQVDFDDREVASLVHRKNIIDVDVAFDVFGIAYMVQFGTRPYDQLDITFEIRALDGEVTWDKLDTLYGWVDHNNNPQKIICYYLYGLPTGGNNILTVQMRREMYQNNYTRHGLELNTKVPISFVETLGPPVVGLWPSSSWGGY